MSTSPEIDIGERRSAKKAGRPLPSVCLAVCVFYVCSSILNGTYIHENAKLKEFGSIRNVWVLATKPLATVSTFLKAHVLRDQVETLRKE
jgi:hypothetical protein